MWRFPLSTSVTRHVMTHHQQWRNPGLVLTGVRWGSSTVIVEAPKRYQGRLERLREAARNQKKNGMKKKFKQPVTPHTGVGASVGGSGDANTPQHGLQEFSLLHSAAYNGWLEVAKRLLESDDFSVHSLSAGNITPLFSAAQRGQSKMCQFLIDQGASVVARDEIDRVPLHCASEAGDVETCKILLKANSEALHWKTARNRTPLHYSIVRGHYDLVKLFLDEGADPNAQEIGGRAGINLAAENGLFDVVKLLISRGVDVEQRSGMEWTPLHGAVDCGDLRTTKFLLEECKADPFPCNKGGGWTPLHMAAANGHDDIIRLYADLPGTKDHIGVVNAGNWTPLHLAVLNNHEEAVVLLLDAGADIESSKVQAVSDVWTPLLIAADSNLVHLVRLLLERGAKPDALTHHGQTSLQFSVRKQNTEMMRVLLEHGADINRRNHGGWSCLLTAISSGFYEGVVELLNCGAKCDIGTPDGWSPLHLACEVGNVALVHLILPLASEIDPVTSHHSKTPLHRAATKGFLDCVQALVQAGANMDARTDSGHTPLEWAQWAGHEEVVNFLTEAGAQTSRYKKEDDSIRLRNIYLQNFAKLSGQFDMSVEVHQAVRPNVYFSTWWAMAEWMHVVLGSSTQGLYHDPNARLACFMHTTRLVCSAVKRHQRAGNAMGAQSIRPKSLGGGLDHFHDLLMQEYTFRSLRDRVESLDGRLVLKLDEDETNGHYTGVLAWKCSWTATEELKPMSLQGQWIDGAKLSAKALPELLRLCSKAALRILSKLEEEHDIRANVELRLMSQYDDIDRWHGQEERAD